MKKPKIKLDYLDREPWHKNYASPMAKWSFNFASLGFQWFQNDTIGFIWFILFNPAIQILYFVSGILILLVWAAGPQAPCN